MLPFANGMSDQNFREIQLSGKQLFFLFMASVVVAVAIFLLGVSVGRGVKTGTLNAGAPAVGDVAQAGDTTVPATLPPATTTTPADKAYHDQLQGQTPPPAQPQPEPPPAAASSKPAEPPTPVSEQAPATATPQAADAGRRAGTPPASTNTGAAPPAAASKPAATPPSPPADASKAGAGVWLVQVGAFASRENADALVAQVKAKGHTASVDTNGPARSRFRVTLGPFADRPAAEGTATRLKREGFSPFVTR